MEPWHYDTAADLDKSLAERLKGFPREPDMLVYGGRLIAAALLRGWLKAYHRLQIRGRERIPREGSFVMVANHSSHLDALCLLSALPMKKLHRAFPALRIIEAEMARGRVYVHCKAGYSRSGAVVGAYLLKAGHAANVEEALVLLRKARPSIIVRPEARRALETFQAELRGNAEPCPSVL